MRIRGTAWVGVAVALAIVVTGCTADDPEAPPSSDSRSSSAPTTSEPTTSEPSVAAPAIPAAASDGDAAGGEAFLRYWFAAANYGLQTGDVAPAKAISADDCAVCNAMFDRIEKAYNSGGSIEGQQFEVLSIAVPPVDETGITLADVRYGQSVGAVLLNDGSREPIAEVPAESAGFVIAFRNGSWSLEGVGEL